MADSPGAKLSAVSRLLGLLRTEKTEIFYLYVYAIINGLIALSLPLGIQAILGLTLANEISSSWILLIVMVTIGTALAGVLQIMQISITERLQQLIFAKASFEFAYRIPRLCMDALLKYYPPELVNRFFDTINLQKGLPKILIDFSTALLQIVFGLIVLSFYHPSFILFGLTLSLLLVLIIQLTGGRGLETSIQESDYKYKVVYWLEELARTLGAFKLAGNTPLPMSKTDTLVSGYLQARKKHFQVLVFQYGNVVAFKTVVTAGLLILGSTLLIGREINLGQFVAAEIIIILIINSIEKIVFSADTIYDVLTAIEKLGKITDLPLERHGGLHMPEGGAGMHVRVRDLSYTYPGDSQPSLYDVSFEATPGQKVCITGYNASGKSLMLNILSGLFENYDGILAYDQIPLTNYDPVSLRQHIGDALSQKVLFRGTLLENLTMGRPEVSLEDVMWALEKLHLLGYVQSLPHGLETLVQPEGPQLPQTIVRKLVLARCIAARPRLLIMDDILLAFQQDERAAIVEFLTSMPWTLIAVSADPRLAARCSQVLVMSRGTIIGRGTFDQICARPDAHDLFTLPL
ncbi:MAG: ATP-binding cassette domain-containing protein [Bacteroidia bacterium]|nr:ATP-binding cassette domain-containing protein [Bacteroidia bacterium]